MSVLACLLLVTVLCAVEKKSKDMPVRPKNVPEEAEWRTHSPLWVSGSYEKGDKKIWDKNGILKYQEKIIRKDRKIIFHYYKNENLQMKGEAWLFKDKYFNNDGNSHGWLDIGKWKEYDEEGNLINEWCYSPPPYKYFETVEKCGIEILYNNDGSIKEKIMHEYKCEYGCDEPE